MPEQPMSREHRLACERALYRYHQALERGDIETIASILQAASHDEVLERMIYAMHDLDQSAELSSTSLYSEQHNHHTEFQAPPQPATRPTAGPPRRGRHMLARLQTLAAVLAVLVLIAGSLLLFHALNTTASPGNHAHTPVPATTVATPQGMLVMLFTNGTIQAVRGVTGQHVWSYATGVGGLGDASLFFYNGLTVQNHAVYAMVKNHVFALNEESGRLLWQKTFPVHLANVTPNNSQMYLDGNTLYVAIQGDNRQVAYALRARNGDQLWQATSNAYSGTPFLTASDGMAYLAIEDGTTFQTRLEARNGSNGHVLWSHQYSGSISFATVANHILYVYAFPGDVPPGNSKLDKRLMAFHAENGDLIWSRDVHYGNYMTNIAYMQNTLVVNDGQTLCVHSASNGSLLWCTPESMVSPDKNTTIDTGIGSYLAGSNRLYVAYIIQKSTPFSPTEVASACKQQPGCTNTVHMVHTQTTLQIKALDYQSGQPLWASQALPLRDAFAFFTLNQVQFQQNTLLMSGGSSLITALDAGNGHTLWHINGSKTPEILQMAATP